MRIGWLSNAPDFPSGYGVQTASVTRRMVADGHEVHIFANHGHTSGVRMWEGAHVWPQGRGNWGFNIADEAADLAGVELVFTLFDVWVFKNAFSPGRRVISWTPVDHYPATPEVLRWAAEHETIAMCEYGDRTLREAGVVPIATIPHTIEDAFRPTESEVRERMGIPRDGFLVTINAANIGTTPPRKNWGGNLEAVARFMAAHDDTYLYIHSDLQSTSGLPLMVLIKAVGIPIERVKVPPPVLYQGGLIDDAELASIYTATDVLLATSKGEGFGVPQIEAMACGTPVIAADFAASTEIVKGAGWLVPAQLDWDQNQASFFCTPLTAGIVSALEDAYQHRGEKREACLERAEQYRADKVYAEHWRPLLASLEAPARKGMSNAAKRRAKKAEAAA